jgi:hypothetical protein
MVGTIAKYVPIKKLNFIEKLAQLVVRDVLLLREQCHVVKPVVTQKLPYNYSRNKFFFGCGQFLK